ncbi:hypothetical protein [Pimelobacter simplex]|uniref:hypothetical protein n=1 Tax=Nocardioides simplex TaxID=2045 RepID=UPI003AABA37D
MGWFELVLITVVTVVVLVVFVRAPRDAPSVGRRFARDHLAYVDSEFVAAFDRETVRRSRVSAAVLLPAMTWYVIALFGSETSTLAATLTPGVVALAASAEGWWRVVRAGREFPVAPGRPGFARGRRPVVRDYVGQVTVVRVVLQAGLGATVAGGALAWAHVAGWTPPAAGLLASGLVILALALATPLAWSVVVRRPQRAVDPAHLYFQDAWRADALRNTGPLPLVAAIATHSALPESSPIAPVGLPVALLAVAIIGTGLLDDVPRLRFRTRLWPTLAPHQVLRPGEPVPATTPGWADPAGAAGAARAAAAPPPRGTPGTAPAPPGASPSGGRSSGPWRP